jgi:hypothetical protein
LEMLIWFNWPMMAVGALPLWTQQWVFGFHKRLGVSWLVQLTLSFSKSILLHGVYSFNLFRKGVFLSIFLCMLI